MIEWHAPGRGKRFLAPFLRLITVVDILFQNDYSVPMARVREFSPDEALKRAVDVFWKKGYFDTSMDDLVSETGVARYGLYGTWGNKRELFLAALERYGNEGVQQFQAGLKKPDAGLRAVHDFFDNLVSLASGKDKLGCMACNTATEVAPHDPEIAKAVRKMFSKLAGSFKNALTNAVASGELKTDHDLDELSEYLAGIIRSVSIMTRAGYANRDIRSYIDISLTVLNQ